MTNDKLINLMADGMQDSVFEHILEDSLICQFGINMLSVKGKEQSQLIREKMRQLAHSVIELNKKFGENKKLLDYLVPSYFTDLMDMAKEMSNIDLEEKKAKSFGTKLGFSLKRCLHILESKAIIDNNVELGVTPRNMISLYKANWYENVSYRALKLMKDKKMMSEDTIPVAADTMKMKLELEERLVKAKEEFENSANKFTYKQLAEITLVRLLFFNKDGEAKHNA